MVDLIVSGLAFLTVIMVYFAFEGSRGSVLSKRERWSRGDVSKRVDKSRRTLTFSLVPESCILFLNRSMERASLPLKGEEPLFLWFVLILTGALAGAFRGPLGMILGTAGGLFIPVLWIKRRTVKRLRKIEEQLPGFLNQISSGLRAGFSFLQSLQNTSERIAPPLGDSLQHLVGELSLGLDLETALRRWVDRTGSLDLDIAVTSILIQREIGGNLANILDGISNLIRDRQKSAAQMRVLTSQGRMEGMVISLLPVALAGVLTLINPEYMSSLFNSPVGHKMLGGAMFMGVIGVAMIQKIVKPKY